MAYVGGGNPNVVVVPQAAPGVYLNYANKTSIVLGVLQIILAIILIVPLIVLFVVLVQNVSSFNLTGPGGNVYYVGGAFYILTGIFGIAAGVSKTKCPIITFMILSIFASIFGVIGFIFWALISAAFGTTRSLNPGNDYVDKVGAVIYSMTVLYLIEAIVAIWSGIICCRVMCCGAGQQSAGAVAVHSYQYPQNQMPMTSPNTYPGQYSNSGYANAPSGSEMSHEAPYHEKPRSHSSSRHDGRRADRSRRY